MANTDIFAENNFKLLCESIGSLSDEAFERLKVMVLEEVMFRAEGAVLSGREMFPLKPPQLADRFDGSVFDEYIEFAKLPLSPPSSPRPAAPQKKVRPNYNHYFWPSPRPKNFARALGFKAKTHEDALVFLSEYAGISDDALLGTSPAQYEKNYMGATKVPGSEVMRADWRSGWRCGCDESI